MPLSRMLPIALTLAVLLLASRGSDAQALSAVAPSATDTRPRDGAATPKESGAALTLKERLGAKWKDEQRVNNCKVPPEKRGSKPRPDRCDHPPAE
jgi:hypothetical protein